MSFTRRSNAALVAAAAATAGHCSDRGKRKCTSFSTGGTEDGHASGTYSHWNGYKADIKPSPSSSSKEYRLMARTLPALIRSGAIGLALVAALTSTASATPDHRTTAVTTLKFTRNATDPQSSRLTVLRDNQPVASYRAGSGLGASHPKGRKECAKMKGWLPAGTYTVGTRHTRYNGTAIKGYAIPLSDHTCEDGRTRRTELFIHSEMTRAGGQAGRRGPEGQRWDGPGDYKSNGCIKLAPEDIKKLFTVLGDGPAPSRLIVS